MSAPATQQPHVPPRPSRSPAKDMLAAATAGSTPAIPPRPANKRLDRSKSPNPERFAPSPFSVGIIKNSNPTNFLSGSNGGSSDPIERSASVPMPSVGEEGLEYSAFTEELKDEKEASSPEQTRTVGEDLKLHAPRPSLPAESAKQRVQGVTRTDSDKAASYGIGKPAYLDERSASRNGLKKKPSTSFSATSESGQQIDDEHGIPEIGQRVPMNPHLGDVQAPSPAPTSEGPGRNHSRKLSARALPPGSYGMHGHGVVPQDELGKAYYKKHPEVLEREHHTPIHDRQNDFAMSSNDLNKLVRDTASRGSGKGSGEHDGTPNDVVAFQASEEYATRIATPRPASIISKDGGAPLEDPGRESSGHDESKPIHVDDPHHPELYSYGVEHAPQGDEEQEYNAPILAADEVEKDTTRHAKHPAVRPLLERNDSSYDGTSRPTSRPSSRPTSIYNSNPIIEFDHTPLEDVREYEPLFPDEANKKEEEEKRRASEESKNRHHFPSKDIWEDAPTSLNYTAEVSTPDNVEEEQNRRKSSNYQDNRPITPAQAFALQQEELAEKEANGKKHNFLPIFEQKPTWVDHQAHLKGERPSAHRFPSRDVWEDTPESLLHEAELNDLPGEEQKDESKEKAKPQIPSRPAKKSPDTLVQPPAIPERPKSRQDKSSKEEATKQLPSNSEAVAKPEIPSRLTKKTSADSKDGELSKPKPPVPSRPVGGKIAALQAGFMSDLNKRLQLGPQGPKKEETQPVDPVEEAEKVPLSDARKGRARGPQRRAPTKSAALATATASAGSNTGPSVLVFSLPQTIWNIDPEIGDVVVASESLEVLAKDAPLAEPEPKQQATEVEQPIESHEVPKAASEEVLVPETPAKLEEPVPVEPRATKAVVVPEASKDVEITEPSEPKEVAQPEEPESVKEETLVSNTAGESILEAKVEKKNDINEVEPVEVTDEVKA